MRLCENAPKSAPIMAWIHFWIARVVTFYDVSKCLSSPYSLTVISHLSRYKATQSLPSLNQGAKTRGHGGVRVHLCRIVINDLHQILAPLKERFGGGISFKVGLEENKNKQWLNTKPAKGIRLYNSVIITRGQMKSYSLQRLLFMLENVTNHVERLTSRKLGCCNVGAAM